MKIFSWCAWRLQWIDCCESFVLYKVGLLYTLFALRNRHRQTWPKVIPFYVLPNPSQILVIVNTWHGIPKLLVNRSIGVESIPSILNSIAAKQNKYGACHEWQKHVHAFLIFINIKYLPLCVRSRVSEARGQWKAHYMESDDINFRQIHTVNGIWEYFVSKYCAVHGLWLVIVDKVVF